MPGLCPTGWPGWRRVEVARTPRRPPDVGESAAGTARSAPTSWLRPIANRSDRGTVLPAIPDWRTRYTAALPPAEPALPRQRWLARTQRPEPYGMKSSRYFPGALCSPRFSQRKVSVYALPVPVNISTGLFVTLEEKMDRTRVKHPIITVPCGRRYHAALGRNLDNSESKV